MANATDNRLNIIREARRDYPVVPVAAGQKLVVGTIAAVSTSGWAGNPSNATYNRVLGIVVKEADNTAGANGDLTTTIRTDEILLVNDGTAPVTAAHIGQVCQQVDNQTVAAPGTASLPAGGRIKEVTAEGIWVEY